MAEIIYNEAMGEWEKRQMLRSPYVDYFNGRFFVTFQAFHNKSVLGAIVGEKCALNELGEAVKAAWLAESERVAGLTLGDFVVMPNHFHAIVEYHSGQPTPRSGDCPTAPSGDRPTAGGRCYTRDPHSRDLPYVIGLFKSYTTTLYHRLKAAGKCIDIGPKLWQDSFYDELIRSDEQYRATAHYIARNPANWNSDRFGEVTSFAEGNIGLLQGEYVAYLSSEGYVEGEGGKVPMRRYASTGHSGPVATKDSGPVATKDSGHPATAPSGHPATAPRGHPATAPSGDPATAPRGHPATAPCGHPATAPCGHPATARGGRCLPVISTFTSHYERQVLAKCLASGRHFIWVCPGGISDEALAKTAQARAKGLALLISPAPTDRSGAIATVNKQRANWCNQFIVKNAAEIWVGHIRPGGSLETILKSL